MAKPRHDAPVAISHLPSAVIPAPAADARLTPPGAAYALVVLFAINLVNFFDRQYRFRGLAQFRTKLDPDRVEPLYVLLSRRMVTPGVARSLLKLLTKRAS